MRRTRSPDDLRNPALPRCVLRPGWMPGLHSIGLHVFDLAARRAGYSFEVAHSDEAREEAVRLRWEVYTERGYIERTAHPDGRFVDPYDDYSTFFLARHRGLNIGTARLIPAREGTQILDQYNFRLPKEVSLPRAAEVGRFAVSPTHRKGSRIAALGLFRIAYGHSLATGVRWWIGNATRGFIRSMSAFNGAIAFPGEGPLEAHHQEARQILPGYFEQLGDEIRLFLVDLDQVKISPARVARMVRGRRS